MKTKSPFLIGKREEEILKAVYFYRYMTAMDVTNLLYSTSSLPHVRKILTALAGGADYEENQLLYRFPLQVGRDGNRVRVYTLGSRGREFLKEYGGLPVAWYFRPSKVRHMSGGHMLHNLALTRFLVAAQRWAEKRSDFCLHEIRTCYELGMLSPKVSVEKEGKEESVIVIPDAWVLFEQDMGRQQYVYPLLLEIDRGSEYRKKFAEHIAARIAFIGKNGLYSKIFGRREVMVVYLTTGETERIREMRRLAMCTWTEEVLKKLRGEAWAPVFRFGSVAYEEIYEGRLFADRVWYVPGQDLSVSLFE